jgi:predicted nucleic acid-binding protein
VTVLEIHFGLKIQAAARWRRLLSQAFEQLLARIGDPVATFDVAASERAHNLMADTQRRGWPVDLCDTMIAGIVAAQCASLAMRNTFHFEGAVIPLVNPWTI